MLRAFGWLPRGFRLATAIVAAQVVVYSALRLAFWLLFAEPTTSGTASEVARAFYIGLKMDLRLATLVCAPLLLLSGARRLDPFASASGRRLWRAYFTVVLVLVVLAYFVDLGHYGYLETRLNAAALQYVGDPLISARMMWETYPVGWGLLALIACALGVFSGLGALLRRPGLSSPSPLSGWRRAVSGAVATLLTLAAVYGKLSWYPLRWSDAYFSTSELVSALALNPVLQLADTFKNRESSYDVAAVRASYDLVADFLQLEERHSDPPSFARHVAPVRRLGRSDVNVVVILLESFASFKVGATGNPLNPTPRFDALARQGLLFTRFYVPHHGTARSVFAALTGIPDVESNETSSRNPLIVTQHTIVNAYSGWSKHYFLGGSATWGNIRGLLTHNIPGLRLMEEGDFRAPRVDVWGISDLHLFEEANRQLRSLDGPFFAIIQTSGHHRPYTIPSDHRGFERSTVPEEELSRLGFVSREEFDSFRFLDHALGFYFREASRERYFERTLFVLLGDHGLPGTSAHLPRGEVELALVRFHVPLLLYAPALLANPGVSDAVGSEIDLLPTIAGLTGTPTTNTTLGRDLLDPRFDGTRYAFTMTDQFRTPEIGLVGRDFYLRMPRGGGRATLHALASDDPVRDASATHPEEAASMQRLCRALYETARYLLHHNAPQTATR